MCFLVRVCGLAGLPVAQALHGARESSRHGVGSLVGGSAGTAHGALGALGGAGDGAAEFLGVLRVGGVASLLQFACIGHG